MSNIFNYQTWQLCQLQSNLFISDEKRKNFINECIAFYIPLMNELKIYPLNKKIETICLQEKNESAYLKIGGLFARRANENTAHIQVVVQKIKTLLKKEGVMQFDISYRLKSLRSIYEKMQKKAIHIEEIFDAYAIRIVVPVINDCYSVLKIINNHFTQLPGAFSNYIETPKKNGYQSIHLVVKNIKHECMEIQIRTQAMHWEAEHGHAAHWRYKTDR